MSVSDFATPDPSSTASDIDRGAFAAALEPAVAPTATTNTPPVNSPMPGSRQLCIAQSTDIKGEGNFPQGCQFSPDGLCVLTSTAADATLRLYNITHQETAVVQPWTSALQSTVVGEVVRSYDWYPQMQSSDPATCIFAATGRDQPVQLIDAYTGGIRATYSPFNEKDELESPTVVKFSPSGDKLVSAGYKTDRMLLLFDASIPGKCGTMIKLGKTKRSSDGQKGLVSAVTFTKDSSLMAVGTYSPGSIYVYDYRQKSYSGSIWNDGCCIVGHGRKQQGGNKKRRFGDDMFSAAKTKWFVQRAQRGITQLEFDSSNNYMLYSASRNSDAILVWDIRMLSGNPDYAMQPIRGFASFATNANTNQRLEFTIDEASCRLWVGGCNGKVLVYDTNTSDSKGGTLLQSIDIPQCVATGDAVNGVSYQPFYDLLAVATGSRRFPSEACYEESDTEHDNDNDGDGNTSMASMEETGENISSPGSLQLFKWNSSKEADMDTEGE